VVQSLVERFNKSQSEVEVKVEFVPETQAHQKLVTAVSAKNPPDCCQMWDQWLGEFVGLSALEDLSDRVKSWKHYGSTVPSAWQALSVNGRIYALPLSITTEAIYLRTDRVKEYGLKMPDEHWTWDDFLALAKGLTKPDKSQYGYGMRGAGKWAVSYATAFLYGNGAQVLRDGKVVINSPEAVAGLEWYLDLFRKWKVTPSSVPTDGYRQIVQGFSRGITSMYMHNSGSVEEQKRTQAIGPERFTTVPIPVGPAKTRAAFYFCETLVMFNASKNKDAVWKFISWMLEDEPHYQFCSVAGNLPTRPAISQRAPFNEAPYAGFTKSFPFATTSPYLAYPAWGGKLESEGAPLLQKAMLGQISAKECLDRWAEVLVKNMA
jgi:multiple sugar transport system substrate-binding protein